MSNHTVLADIGGTHARLARLTGAGHYDLFHKYRLDSVAEFADIIHRYQSDTGLIFEAARFAIARTPVNGVISYKRFAGDPDYVIDFNQLHRAFGWTSLSHDNDLEAAMLGVPFLSEEENIVPVIPSVGSSENTHRLLVSVGTGAGHAALINGAVIKTHGGHFLPAMMETDEHQQLAAFIRARKDENQSLIIEDFVSSRGLCHIASFISGQEVTHALDGQLLPLMQQYPAIGRLFFEWLGLHAHVIVAAMGLYGGVYYTGGVIDYLYDHHLCDWEAYHRAFKARMVSVVDQSFSSVPVFYVSERELPLLGLTSERRA